MAANKIQKVFCRGVYLAENTSQAASVEFVPPAGGQIMRAADCKNLSQSPEGVLRQSEKSTEAMLRYFFLSYFAFLTPEDFQACSARETAMTP